jgi:hypothetical protein
LAPRKTAILLFSLSEDEEKQRKAFYHDSGLHQLLVQRVQRTIAKSGMDFFHFSEKEQAKGDFGTRFCDAIERIYAKGYNAVITIGNDSPNLSVSHILKAKKALERNEFVLGPSYDGGFYLMGLQKEHFKKAIFENFSWNTSKVATEIKQYIKQHLGGALLILRYLRDLDNCPDLKALLKSLTPSLALIGHKIELILQKVNSWDIGYIEGIYSFYYSELNYNKGSPKVFS